MVTSWYGCTKDVNKLALEKPFDSKVANGKTDMCTMHVSIFASNTRFGASIKARKQTKIFSCRAWGGSKQKEKKKKEEERKAKEKSFIILTEKSSDSYKCLRFIRVQLFIWRHIENPWYVLLFIVVFHLRLLVVNISCTDSLVNSL